jgi:hypothetical protein
MESILITIDSLTKYAGAELVVLDLVEEASSRGFTVTIAVFQVTPKLKELFDALGVFWIDLSKDNPPEAVLFDILWIHHSSSSDVCLLDYGIRAKKILFSCLSSFVAIEFPPSYASCFSMLIANSEETKAKLMSFDFLDELITVVPNPVPASDFQLTSSQRINMLNRIAVISNHVPAEILDAIVGLKAQGKTVDVYGLSHKIEKIDAKILLNYDLIITIGRTVQQCIVLGVPVYCYDHFGGPGYLREENFAKSAYFNFSGRCSTKKTADFIVNEIIEEYSAGIIAFKQLSEVHRSSYNLSNHVNSVIQTLNSKRDVNLDVNGLFQLELARRKQSRSSEKVSYSYAALYFATGADVYFLESKQIVRRLIINKDDKSLDFEFPKGAANVKALRLDLVDSPAFLEIHEMRLADASNQTIWCWDHLSNQVCSPSDDLIVLSSTPATTLLSIGSDPNFVLNIGPSALHKISEGVKLTVDCTIRPLSEGVHHLKRLTEVLQSTVDTLKSSLTECQQSVVEQKHAIDRKIVACNDELRRAEYQLDFLKDLLNIHVDDEQDYL